MSRGDYEEGGGSGGGGGEKGGGEEVRALSQSIIDLGSIISLENPIRRHYYLYQIIIYRGAASLEISDNFVHPSVCLSFKLN